MIEFIKFYIGRSNRKYFVFILLLTIISSILETLSILAIFPLVTIIFDLNSTLESQIMTFFNNNFLFDKENNLKGLLIASFIIIILSSILNFINLYFIQKYAYKSGQQISVDLFKSYLKKDLIYFLENNTSEITKNLISETQRLIDGLILQFLSLIPKLTSSIFIMILLLIYNFQVTIYAILTVSILYFSYYLIIKKKLFNLGLNASKHLQDIHKILKQSFNLIELIKLKNKNQYFETKYSEHTLKFANYNISSSIISLFPKYLFEIVFFIILLFVVLNLFNENLNLIYLLPTFGLYFFAFMRVFPHFQSLYHGISTMNLNLNSYKLIKKDLEKNLTVKVDSNFKQKNFKSLELKKISFKYPQSNTKLMINFKINRSQKIAIVGNSGSGKSSFLKILAGLLKYQSGFFNIIDTSDKNISKKSFFVNNLSYLNQSINLLDNSITSNIAFADDFIDMVKINESLAKADLQELTSNSNNFRNIGDGGIKLSGGQKQRLAISRIIYENKEFIIMDEFDTSLDTKNIDKLIKLFFFNKNKTIVFSTHNKKLLKFADQIYEFKNNELMLLNTKY